MEYKRAQNGDVEIIPGNVPLVTLIKEIARQSYELAVPVGLGFLQPSGNPFDESDASLFIHPESSDVLVMDYVNGRQCKTFIYQENGKLFLRGNLYEGDRGPVEPLLDKVKQTFEGKEKTPVPKYNATNSDLAIDTSEMQEKLANLERHMENRSATFLQGMDSTVYEFARLLSKRLNPRLVPSGFVLSAELLIYDLHTGIDGFSHKPMDSKLVGMPEPVYQGLRLYLPEIAKAVAPVEFAEAVKEGYEEIQLKAKGSDKLK